MAAAAAVEAVVAAAAMEVEETGAAAIDPRHGMTLICDKSRS
ncbi:MAG: hypothetical protein WA418_13395 [Bradyrhizobium sp.]